MIALFRLLPFSWKILALVSLLLTISGSVYAIHRSIYNSGYKSCQADTTEEIRVHNDEAREKIISLESGYKKRLEEISKIGTDDNVGAGVSSAIDLMP